MNYGQFSKHELDCAANVVHHYTRKKTAICSLKVVKIDGLDVAEKEDFYFPARNTVLLAIATSFAESMDIGQIFIGLIGRYSNETDNSYPDGNGEFVDQMEGAINVGTYKGLAIVTPLMDYNKTQVLRKALELEVPISLTRSCLTHSKLLCGKCKSCVNRARAFFELEVEDTSLLRLY